MARVTVEDCIAQVENRFELILLATRRARELSNGAKPTVARDNDRNPVIALREIAEGSTSINALRQSVLHQHSSIPYIETEESISEDTDDLPISDLFIAENFEEEETQEETMNDDEEDSPKEEDNPPSSSQD